MSSNSEHSKGLDLGLSALLRDLEKSAPSSTADVITAAPSSTALSSEPAAPTQLNEFEKLADGQRWVELIRLCEEQMTDSVQDRPEPRLWWVMAQLKSAQLPVGLVVAPLEAALEPVSAGRTDPRIATLAARTLAVAGDAASRAGDGELRVTMCHRASLLDVSHEPALVVALDAEETRLRAQTGLSSGQQAARDKRLRELLAMRPAGEQTPAERVLAMARAGAASSAVERSDKSRVAGTVIAKGGKTLSPRHLNMRHLAVVTVVLMLLLSAVWVMMGKPEFGLSSAEVGEAVATSLRSAGVPELKLSKNTMVDTVSAFDGLYYDLKGESRTGSGAAQSARSAPSSVNARPGGAAKKVLSMDGPPEPPEMRQALLQPERAPVDNTAATLFGGGEAGRGATVVEAERRFQGDRIFKALVRTPILAQPRYQAQSLGTLSVGDRVSAEGRVEDWLQIRSSSGRVGFVLAQDLDPER